MIIVGFKNYLHFKSRSGRNISVTVRSLVWQTYTKNSMTVTSYGGYQNPTTRKRRHHDEFIDDSSNVLGSESSLAACSGQLELEEECESSVEQKYHLIDDVFKIPLAVWNRLYRYQQEGVEWLWGLHKDQCGGILGDEMGLGKTVQVITFISGLICSDLNEIYNRSKYPGPILIVCPATLIWQWQSEFRDWCPSIKVSALHRSVSKDDCYLKKMFRRRPPTIRQVILCTYSGLLIYNDILSLVDFSYVILDEGHKIRNPDAKITNRCKLFNTPHRIIISGSPVQNNLRELWCLFDFVFPGKLGPLDKFMELFAIPIQQGGYSNATKIQVQMAFQCATVLKDAIKPLLLRRLKSDHSEISLPMKNEQVLFCRLTDHQMFLYEQYLSSKDCISAIQRESHIFVAVGELRKICNHPDLFTCGEEDTKERWKRSGKMRVVHTLLRAWNESKRKVLLFSQSRKMLEILEEYLESQSYSFVRMDGNTIVTQRQFLIEKFNKDPSIFVFLLTTRVGGLGLNLTGASRVIIYDPDWNPSVDMQARERVWRIGQREDVTIYRLVSSGSIEEKIFHRQIYKQFLAERVLINPKQRRFFKTNDIHDLFTFGNSQKAHRVNNGHCRTETEELLRGSNAKCIRSSNIPKRNEYVELVTIDGISVPDLDKTKATEEIVRESNAHEQLKVINKTDDYVISKLLENNKVHCALEPDTIIASDNKDFAIIQMEAEAYAKKALKDLNESRNPYKPIAAVPIVNVNSRQVGTANILANIRRRKQGGEVDVRPSGINLLGDIVAFMKERNDCATSEQLIRNFGHRIEDGSQIKFKSLLKSVANLEKCGNDGDKRVWKLVPEISEKMRL